MYKIELQGASGGFIGTEGGRGSYTSGTLPIFRPQPFYIYLGQKGEWLGPSTYNGGGAGTTGVKERYNEDYYVSGGAGGGASDIRLTKGDWNNFESLKSRITVAAGGAGFATIEGGAGGVLEGYNGTIHLETDKIMISLSTGGTQTSGGLGSNYTGHYGGFGYGGDCRNPYHGSGGGSGYYGGGSGGMASSQVTSGSGGSSYVSGYKGCRAIARRSTENNIDHEDSSIHYSGITFYHPEILDGKAEIPCPDPASSNSCTERGHYGNGYARITVLEQHDPITIMQCSPMLYYASIAMFNLIIIS